MPSIIGNLLFAWEHWVKAKANENELAKELRGRILTLSKTEAGKQWVESLTEQDGELVAIQALKMLRGLPGYPKQTFWAYLFHIGVPMELVVTRTHLLFFDPTFGPDAKLTVIDRNQRGRISINFGDGSMLYIKLKGGTIVCKVGGPMEAKPIFDLLMNTKPLG